MSSSWYCYRSGNKLGPYSDEQMIELINSQQVYDDDDFINEEYSLDVLCLEDAKGYLFHLKKPDDLPTGFQTQAPQHPPIAYQNQAPQYTPIGSQSRNAYGQQNNTGTKARKRCINCNKKLTDDESFCLRCGTPKNSSINRNQFNDKNRKIPVIIATVLIAPVALVAIFFMVRFAANQIKILSVNIINQESIAASMQTAIKQKSAVTSKQTSGKQESTTAREKIPASVGRGSFKGRTYYNSDLGLKYTIPQGLVIGTYEQVAKIDTKLGLSGGLRVFVARYKLYSKVQYNDNSKLYIEKMPSLFPPSLEEYAEALKTEMVTNNPGLVFGEIMKKSIDGVKFVVFKGKYHTLSQETYIIIRNGYYVNFMNTYKSNKTKELFDKMISSIKFS